jgi:uncharacterized protein (TIGR02996 family)
MCEERAYLEAVRANPEADEPRLALADWLLRQAEEAQRARGELVRWQCELARLRRNDPRREEAERRTAALRSAHERTWLGPLADLAYRWHRGLVHLRVERSRWSFALLGELGAAEAWRWVDGLNLWNSAIGNEGAQALAGSAHLYRLSALGLWNNDIGAAGARALAGSAYLGGLSALELGLNNIGAEGAEALAGSAHLARLSTLVLWNNDIGVAGARALAGSLHLARLSSLDLGDNNIGDEGAQALASSVYLARLAWLNLRHNGIGPEGERAIRTSPFLRLCKVLLRPEER